MNVLQTAAPLSVGAPGALASSSTSVCSGHFAVCYCGVGFPWSSDVVSLTCIPTPTDSSCHLSMSGRWRCSFSLWLDYSCGGGEHRFLPWKPPPRMNEYVYLYKTFAVTWQQRHRLGITYIHAHTLVIPLLLFCGLIYQSILVPSEY